MTSKTVMVVAMAQGFYGHLREPGDQFEVTLDDEDPNGGIGKWMREVNKKGEVVLTKEEKKDPATAPVIPSSPFTPPAQTYKVKHIAGGNFAVVDPEGNQVGEQFKKVPGKQAAAKEAAMAAAEAMNKGAPAVTLSPAQAEMVKTQTAMSLDPSLNDSSQSGVDDDDPNHPDA